MADPRPTTRSSLSRIRAFCETQRHMHRSAATDAGENAFFAGQAFGGCDRFLARDGKDFIELRAIQNLRHKAGADALDLA